LRVFKEIKEEDKNKDSKEVKETNKEKEKKDNNNN
jgi:hypothetical protein